MSEILNYETVEIDKENKLVKIVDQTLLPNEIQILELKNGEEMWRAINILQVRGAPAIGVFAGFAIYLLADKLPDSLSYEEFYTKFVKLKDYLNSSRPTAVNLSWALNRMEKTVISNKEESVASIKEILYEESVKIKEEDVAMCKAIGEHGLSLVKKGDGLLTHCNAGQLATSKYGTATAPMYLGHERGYNFKVFCDETRPLLQGARLTSYELSSAGLDVTLICDNMASIVMKKGLINAVFVGADRIASNGDAANKIGTSGVAILAKHYGIPFYVCAPYSTIDMNIKSGDEIVIEERNGDEIKKMWYERPMAPDKVKTFNPAFDVTDNTLISAIVTEKGIIRPPFSENILRAYKSVAK